MFCLWKCNLENSFATALKSENVPIQKFTCRCISWIYYFMCAQEDTYKDVIAAGNNKKLEKTQIFL